MAWRPGTYVTAEVEVGQDRVPVRVPKAALQTVEGKRIVFVRTDEGSEKREVGPDAPTMTPSRSLPG